MLDPALFTFTNQIDQQIHICQGRSEVVGNNVTKIYQLGVLKSEKVSISLDRLVGLFAFGNIIYNGHEGLFMVFFHELKVYFNWIPTSAFPFDLGLKHYFILVATYQEVNQSAKLCRGIFWDEIFQGHPLYFIPRILKVPECFIINIFEFKGIIIKNIDLV